MAEVMAEFYDGPHATPKPADSGGVYLGIKNLTDSGHLDLSQVRFIAEHDIPKWTKRVTPREGDIVFSYEATLHRYAVIPSGFHGTLGRRLALIRVDEDVMRRDFLLYTFLSPQWRRVIESRMNIGSTVDRIPLTEFPDYPIAIPPLESQDAIVHVLRGFDDLISTNRRRIEILEEMARLLYREWFVHFRFPGYEDVELVDSELGRIPEGWEVTRTSDLIATGELEIGDGYRAKNAEMTGGPLRFLRVKNVQEAHFAALEEADSFPAEYTEVVGPKRSRTGDIAIAMKGSVGRLARVDESTPPLVYSPQTSYWRVNRPGRLSSTFLYEWMQGPSFVQQCAQVKGATDMADYVNLKDQRSMRLALAPTELVRCFGDRVDPQLDLAANLRRQNAVLRETRDLLLPRLVSGELDVSELDLDGVLA